MRRKSSPLIHNQFLYLVLNSLFLCSNASGWLLADGTQCYRLDAIDVRSQCVLPFASWTEGAIGSLIDEQLEGAETARSGLQWALLLVRA